MNELRVLAITVASGRIGYVFLIGGRLEDWGMSRTGTSSEKAAAEVAKRWIAKMRPIVVITEDHTAPSRKGKRSRCLISALANTAKQSDVIDVQVRPHRTLGNKYQEAKAMAEDFPELCPWVPKPRRIWDSEPRAMVYFEALSLAVEVMKNPSERLAAAMG